MATNEIVSKGKSILAKLLAEENITIEFRNVSTALFNVADRVLVLPNYKEELSPELYNLFIGHEVAHALFTPPQEYMKEHFGIKHNLLNIVEDIRIEKLIQKKYPGLRKDFIKGYNDLLTRDFFGIKHKKIQELSFVDRLNINAKCGTQSNVPFTPEEQILIDEGFLLESFDDVLKYCHKIVDFVVNKKSSTYTPTHNNDKKILISDDENDLSDDENNLTAESNNNTDNGEKQKPKKIILENEIPYGFGASVDETRDNNHENDELETITDKELEKNIHEFLDNVKNDIVTVNIPTFNLESVIVNYNLFLGTFQHNIKFAIPSFQDIADKLYQKYIQMFGSSISHMIKEFELHKNAKQMQKIQINKTGILDCKKIHNYQLTPDIFRKNAYVSGGQSHGLVLFIDWSSSMEGYIYDCCQQLFCLTDFCRKQKIPFEVYSFKSGSKKSTKDLPIHSSNVGDMIFDHFSLVNLLSSKMTHAQYVLTQKYLLFMLSHNDRNGHNNHYLQMNSTPLNHCIAAACQIIPNFKKINNLQIVNSVFITDGDSTQTYRYIQNQTYTGSFFHGQKVYINDPITKHVIPVVWSGPEMDWGGKHVTRELLQHLQIRTNANVVGFFLTTFLSHTRFNHPNNDPIQSNWNKRGYYIAYGVGYTEYYILKISSLSFHNESLDKIIEKDYSDLTLKESKKIERAFLHKTTNSLKHKIILTSFIKMIS